MDYDQFLERVIHLGIVAARKDYTEDKGQSAKLHGSIAGFESCKGKNSKELNALLIEAKDSTYNSFRLQEDPETYWFKRCYELEIEWVCNVVSAMLLSQGLPAIIPPTAKGMIEAVQILRTTGE